MAVKGCDVWAGWAVGQVVLELHGVAASMIAEACCRRAGPVVERARRATDSAMPQICFSRSKMALLEIGGDCSEQHTHSRSQQT